MFLRGELSTVPADGTLWPSTLVRVLWRQRGGAGRLRARHLRGVERSSPQRPGCFQANVLASCSESHAVFAADGVSEFDNLVGVSDLHVQEEAADVALVLLARRCDLHGQECSLGGNGNAVAADVCHQRVAVVCWVERDEPRGMCVDPVRVQAGSVPESAQGSPGQVAQCADG